MARSVVLFTSSAVMVLPFSETVAPLDAVRLTVARFSPEPVPPTLPIVMLP